VCFILKPHFKPTATPPPTTTTTMLFLLSPRFWGFQAYRALFGYAVWHVATYLYQFTQSQGFTDQTTKTYFPFAMHQLQFWVTAALYSIIDVFNFPRSLVKYKVQPKVHNPNDKLAHCAFIVFINQVCLLLPLFIVAYPFTQQYIKTDMKDLPTLPIFLRDLVIFALIEEVMFYWSHYLLHTQFLYQYIHKVHHEFHSPVAMAAEYAHPVEFLIANIIPPLIGPLVCQSHIIVWFWWNMIVLLDTMHSHSGYDLPFIPVPTATRHDYHHSTNIKSNLGAIKLFDVLFRTHIETSTITGDTNKESVSASADKVTTSSKASRR